MKIKSKTQGSIKDKFRNQKADLMKRHQEQVDNKDSGSSFATIFDNEKIPKGREFWKCGKGEHLIDIIPFFSGSQHPRVKEGELAYAPGSSGHGDRFMEFFVRGGNAYNLFEKPQVEQKFFLK